jgi:hypothetical protein
VMNRTGHSPGTSEHPRRAGKRGTPFLRFGDRHWRLGWSSTFADTWRESRPPPHRSRLPGLGGRVPPRGRHDRRPSLGRPPVRRAEDPADRVDRDRQTLIGRRRGAGTGTCFQSALESAPSLSRNAGDAIPRSTPARLCQSARVRWRPRARSFFGARRATALLVDIPTCLPRDEGTHDS